jgi:hypothetical protein
MKRAAFQNPTNDVFQKWAALPEWEKHYRRFYAMGPESDEMKSCFEKKHPDGAR